MGPGRAPGWRSVPVEESTKRCALLCFSRLDHDVTDEQLSTCRAGDKSPHCEPYERRGPSHDSVPGKRREAVAADDRDERFDDDHRDDEGNQAAKADPGELAGRDLVPMLEHL